MNKLLIVIIVFIALLFQLNIFLLNQSHATKQISIDLCDRLNILEFHLMESIDLTDCDELYQ